MPTPLFAELKPHLAALGTSRLLSLLEAHWDDGTDLRDALDTAIPVEQFSRVPPSERGQMFQCDWVQDAEHLSDGSETVPFKSTGRVVLEAPDGHTYVEIEKGMQKRYDGTPRYDLNCPHEGTL